MDLKSSKFHSAAFIVVKPKTQLRFPRWKACFELKASLKEDIPGPGLRAEEAGTVVSSHRVHDLLEVAGHLHSCSRLDSGKGVPNTVS